MIELSELINIVSDRQRLRGRWDRLPQHIDYFSEFLRKRRAPTKTTSLIVLPYTKWQSKPDWKKVIALSKYRTLFSVIEELSILLAPAVVEIGIVPQIIPVMERSLKEMNWRTPFVRAITDNGVLLFDKELSIEPS